MHAAHPPLTLNARAAARSPMGGSTTTTETDAVLDAIVVGGGLAGLACGRALQREGLRFVLLEAADRVGGRVATDRVDGFLVDRGFQVLLSAYPEVRASLDLDALGVRSFESGALVHRRGRFWRVADPWRDPLRALTTLRAPFVSLADGWRLAALRRDALRGRARVPGGSAAEELRARGIGRALTDAFLRPFFGGVTLDPELGVPATWFLKLFGWFARGSAVLPAEGMGAIGTQLASSLPRDAVRTRTRVTELGTHHVVLECGARLAAHRVVLATDAFSAGELLGEPRPERWLGTTTLSYAAARSPVGEPILVLCGDGPAAGPVNHLCVPSDAQPSYAPAGSALVSVSLLGAPTGDDGTLDRAVRVQLRGWYGSEVDDWRLLRIDRVPRALPPVASDPDEQAERNGVWLCGDHVHTPSIQGALLSGRRTGERLAEDRCLPA